MNDTMLAAVVTPKKTLEVRSLPLPRFGSYEALVEMRFGATCAGTDQRVIDHGHPRPLRYPGILGHESVGRVIAVGEKATSFAVGDLITRVGAPETEEISSIWGGFATVRRGPRLAGDGARRSGRSALQKIARQQGCAAGHSRARRADDHHLAGNAQLRAAHRRAEGHARAYRRFRSQRAGVHEPLRLRGGGCLRARHARARGTLPARRGAGIYRLPRRRPLFAPARRLPERHRLRHRRPSATRRTPTPPCRF